MLRTSESETEILLGNKQLLGIFFVVAILLGAAFTGGYMIGRGATGKKPVVTQAAAQNEGASAGVADATGGETHSIPAESTDTGSTAPDTNAAQATSPRKAASTPEREQEPPLGSPGRKSFEQAHPQAADAAAANSNDGFAPQSGQEFLQVGAVGHDEADAIADVLRKKGFQAHAVPKPGNGKLYRVLIGPVKDAADLSATRDSLRKTGFREVIVQKY